MKLLWAQNQSYKSLSYNHKHFCIRYLYDYERDFLSDRVEPKGTFERICDQLCKKDLVLLIFIEIPILDVCFVLSLQ